MYTESGKNDSIEKKYNSSTETLSTDDKNSLKLSDFSEDEFVDPQDDFLSE